MRISYKAALGFIILISFSLVEVYAGGAGSTVGNALLRGTPGARVSGIGGAYTGVAEGPVTIYYNPAGLNSVNRSYLLLQHDVSFLNINRSDIAFAMPAFGGGFGLGFSLIDYGSITRTTTINKTDAGSFSASDLLIRTGYGHKLNENFSFGGSLGFYHLKIAGVTASGVTTDLGMLYKPVKGLTLGTSLRNIGSRARFFVDQEELPLAIVFGSSYKVLNSLLFSLDYEIVRKQRGIIRIGTEYKPIEHLALRAGYNGSNETDNGLTFGAGFSVHDICLDYAYVPFGDFGQSHRFSLQVAFGKPKEEAPVTHFVPENQTPRREERYVENRRAPQPVPQQPVQRIYPPPVSAPAISKQPVEIPAPAPVVSRPVTQPRTERRAPVYTLSKHESRKIFVDGVKFYNEGAYERALFNFNQKLAGDPDLETYYYAGMCYVNLNRLTEAIEHFNQGLAISPSDYDLNLTLATTYFHLNDYRKSLEIFQNLQRYYPDDTLIKTNIKVLQNLAR